MNYNLSNKIFCYYIMENSDVPITITLTLTDLKNIITDIVKKELCSAIKNPENPEKYPKNPDTYPEKNAEFGGIFVGNCGCESDSMDGKIGSQLSSQKRRELLKRVSLKSMAVSNIDYNKKLDKRLNKNNKEVLDEINRLQAIKTKKWKDNLKSNMFSNNENIEENLKNNN